MVTKVAGSKTIKIYTSTPGDVVTIDGVSKVASAKLSGKSHLVDLGAAETQVARQLRSTTQVRDGTRLVLYPAPDGMPNCPMIQCSCNACVWCVYCGVW